MKDQLDFEKDIKNNMTMIQVVQHYFPKWTDKEADFFIWNRTCYPMSTDQKLNQIYSHYQKSIK